MPEYRKSRFKCDICGSKSYSVDLEDVPDNARLSQEHFSIVKCDNCLHRSTYPIPAIQELSKYYPETYYAHVGSKKSFRNKIKWSLKRQCYRNAMSGKASSNHASTHAQCSRLGKFLAEPPLTGKRRLLDVGCGAGEYIRFAKSRGWQASGIEIDAKAVDSGIKAGLDIVQGSAESLPVESDSFDVVRMWHVLEHAYSPMAVLAEVNRVLRPRGFFLLSVPNFASSQRIVLGNCWPHLDVPRHLHHFNPESLKKALESNGFIKITSFYSGAPFLEIPWRLAICRSQGKNLFASTKLVTKSVTFEVLRRAARRDEGSLLTWWVQKQTATPISQTQGSNTGIGQGH